LKLGVLNYKEGLIPRSVNYFQRNFDLARELKENELIDAARVNFGIANGMKNYKTITKDLKSLKEWIIYR